MNILDEILHKVVSMLTEDLFIFYPEITRTLKEEDNVHHIELGRMQPSFTNECVAIQIESVEAVKFNESRVSLIKRPVVVASFLKGSNFAPIHEASVDELTNKIYKPIFTHTKLMEVLLESTSAQIGMQVLLKNSVKTKNKDGILEEIKREMPFILSEFEANIVEKLESNQKIWSEFNAKNIKLYSEPRGEDFSVLAVPEGLKATWKPEVVLISGQDIVKLGIIELEEELNIPDYDRIYNPDYEKSIANVVKKMGIIYLKNKKGLALENEAKLLFKKVPERLDGVVSRNAQDNATILPRLLSVVNDEAFSFMINEVSTTELIININLQDRKGSNYFLKLGANGIYLEDILTKNGGTVLDKGVYLYKRDSNDPTFGTLDSGKQKVEKLLGKNAFTKKLMQAYDLRVKAGFEGVKPIQPVKKEDSVQNNPNASKASAKNVAPKPKNGIKSTGVVFELSEEDRQQFLNETSPSNKKRAKKTTTE